MYIYTSIYIFTRWCVCTYILTYYIYMYVYIYIYIYIYIYTHIIYIYIYVYIWVGMSCDKYILHSSIFVKI